MVENERTFSSVQYVCCYAYIVPIFLFFCTSSELRRNARICENDGPYLTIAICKGENQVFIYILIYLTLFNQHLFKLYWCGIVASLAPVAVYL